MDEVAASGDEDMVGDVRALEVERGVRDGRWMWRWMWM